MASTLGLRHAVLWVTDPEASAAFYADLLGLEVKSAMPGAVFMTAPESATDHDLGLFAADAPPSGPRGVGLYHLSWEVATLGELIEVRSRAIELGAHVGESSHGVSRSLYLHDPDGIEFEVMWEVPEDLLTEAEKVTTTERLDLDADIERFGLDLPGRGAASTPRGVRTDVGRKSRGEGKSAGVRIDEPADLDQPSGVAPRGSARVGAVDRIEDRGDGRRHGVFASPSLFEQ